MKKIMLIVSLVCVTASVGLAQANPDVYYARRVSHFETLPITGDDIIMLGNSLTDGAEWHELLNNPHVKNRGIIGDIVQGAIERIGPILSGQPRKLFILCGVNDVSHGVSGDSIARVMETLIGLVKQFYPHLASVRGLGTAKATTLYDVTWINLYPLFDDGTGHLKAELTNDGLHLMGEGYLIWRDTIQPYVDK